MPGAAGAPAHCRGSAPPARIPSAFGNIPPHRPDTAHPWSGNSGK